MVKDPDITLKMVMDHLLVMQGTLQAEIRSVRSDLMDEIGKVYVRINRLETNLSTQIDGIDSRLDGIELESLPQRLKTVEHIVLSQK